VALHHVVFAVEGIFMSHTAYVVKCWHANGFEVHPRIPDGTVVREIDLTQTGHHEDGKWLHLHAPRSNIFIGQVRTVGEIGERFGLDIHGELISPEEEKS
jgi:hypothetical protein